MGREGETDRDGVGTGRDGEASFTHQFTLLAVMFRASAGPN